MSSFYNVLERQTDTGKTIYPLSFDDNCIPFCPYF